VLESGVSVRKSQQSHSLVEGESPIVVRSLLSSKRMPHFKIRISLERIKYGHGIRQDPKPRTVVPARSSSSLLDWTGLDWKLIKVQRELNKN
jgi:hypothetical protein